MLTVALDKRCVRRSHLLPRVWRGEGSRIVRPIGGLFCTVLLAACGSSGQQSASPPTGVGTELNTAVPPSLSSVSLTDQSGHHLTLGSFPGKIVVISDLLTLCQETCAIGTASMLQAARAVNRSGLGDKVEFLSITVDPRRDDLHHLSAYRKLFGKLPNWTLATGSVADINRLWDKLGVWRRTVSLKPPYPRDWLTAKPLTVDIQHSDDLIFIGPNARFRYLIDGPGAVGSTKSIPATIFGFMDRLGHKNVTKPDPGSWSATDVVAVLRWLAGDSGAT